MLGNGGPVILTGQAQAMEERLVHLRRPRSGVASNALRKIAEKKAGGHREAGCWKQGPADETLPLRYYYTIAACRGVRRSGAEPGEQGSSPYFRGWSSS